MEENELTDTEKLLLAFGLSPSDIIKGRNKSPEEIEVSNDDINRFTEERNAAINKAKNKPVKALTEKHTLKMAAFGAITKENKERTIVQPNEKELGENISKRLDEQLNSNELKEALGEKAQILENKEEVENIKQMRETLKTLWSTETTPDNTELDKNITVYDADGNEITNGARNNTKTGTETRFNFKKRKN